MIQWLFEARFTFFSQAVSQRNYRGLLWGAFELLQLWWHHCWKEWQDRVLFFKSISCCYDYWMHPLKTNNNKTNQQPPQYPIHPIQQIIKQVMLLAPRSAEKQQALHGAESNGCNIKTMRNKPGSNSWKPEGKQLSNALGIMGLNDRSLWFIVLNVFIFICPLQHSALSPNRFDNGLFAVT